MSKKREMGCGKEMKFGVKREKNCTISYVCLKRTDRITFSTIRSVGHQKEKLVRSCFFASFLLPAYAITFIMAEVKAKVPSVNHLVGLVIPAFRPGSYNIGYDIF
jgi:hypothetical protein